MARRPRSAPAPAAGPAADYVRVSLSGDEPAQLARLAAAAGESRQAVIRGLLHLAAADPDLLARAVATQTPAAEDRTPGLKRGHGPDDYKRALAEAGSVQGAARLLGVHRTTVDEMMRRHKLRPPKRQPA